MSESTASPTKPTTDLAERVGDSDTQERSAPPTAEELSAGLERLADELEAFADQTAGSLEELDEVDVKVQAQIDQLRMQLDELLKRKREREIEPRPWPDRVGREDWDDLVQWVDWLQHTYELRGEYTIHPCWPAHSGVVQELAGLYHSWRFAQVVDEVSVPTIATADGKSGKRPGSNDVSAWHDRWLWPCLNRIKTGHYRYSNCSSEGHQPALVIVSPTDRTFIPAPPATPS